MHKFVKMRSPYGRVKAECGQAPEEFPSVWGERACIMWIITLRLWAE